MPRGDLMSDLIHATFKDGSKPDFDVVSGLARFLFGAGQDTTSRLIAMAILILGEDPMLQQRSRDQPERIADFIEETLCYDAPVKVAYRLALADTTVGAMDIPAGTILTVCYNAASNDPAHFEHPERFDIDRLLARVSDIWISDEHHGPAGARSYRFEPTYTFRSLAELHVEFTAI